MSNFKKALNNVKLLSIVAAVVLAVALIAGIVFGVSGWGVFNKGALLKDAKTLSVDVNKYAYQTQMEAIEAECEKVLAPYGIEYKMESEMSGDVCEIVYVFDKEVDLATAVQTLETTFAGQTWKDASVEVSFAVNSEVAASVLAEGYVWRGVVAGVVMAVLVFAYVALRHGLFKGVAVGGANLLAVLMTVAVVILTRLPVTASAIYVFAMAGLFSSVVALVALKKVEEMEEGALAVKEVALVTAPVAAAFVLVGAIAVPGVRWFAVLGLVAILVAAVVALFSVPTFYLPFKIVEDNKPVEGVYVGATKTSTKEKKVFEKKVEPAPVKPVEEVAEETPVEEAPVEEAEVEEAPVEETPVEETEVEEAPVEEAPVEEAEVEETTEEVPEAIPVNEEELEEVPVETVDAEEVPVAEVEEEKQD